jgi:hypothetical protein
MADPHSQISRTLQGDPALLQEAEAALAKVTAPDQSSSKTESEKQLIFPQAAWRGIFSEYREAVKNATEASDVFHFATLWALCAATLGRRVWFSYGMKLFPNAYLVCFGRTGDRKTTATRRATELGTRIKIVRGGGSGEGIADAFSGTKPGEGLLMYAEEFSQILRPGRWEGATLLPFLTQCFDCPVRYEMKFRKSPVELDEPTPTLLAGTTADWFWQDFRPKDFAGGFGTRLLFLTGMRKPPIPLPDSPDLRRISNAVDDLASIEPCQVQLETKARALWEEFYGAWIDEDERRDSYLLTVVQRILPYVLKLGIVYAATEGTLPAITLDQLSAAILVGRYAESCVKELLSLQNAGTNARKELERRILALVKSKSGRTFTKRDTYRKLHRYYTDSEMFNRAFDSLVRAGELYVKSLPRGMVLVSTEPLV